MTKANRKETAFRGLNNLADFVLEGGILSTPENLLCVLASKNTCPRTFVCSRWARRSSVSLGGDPPSQTCLLPDSVWCLLSARTEDDVDSGIKPRPVEGLTSTIYSVSQAGS